ncbi:MAG: oligopeptide transporter, OPT family, partial [Clostridia bacterium]|nr:oligopeptide transporter, OPT family [Clostridia bacterium]
LFCSGMIAGEGLIGIVLAILAIFGVDTFINISGILNLSSGVSQILSLVVFALIILSLLMFSVFKKQKKAKNG